MAQTNDLVRVPKAIIFDVDGTLYRQRPLRRAMLVKLAAAYAAHPIRGWRTMSALRAFRRAQEELRDGDHTSTDQVRVACERSGIDAVTLTAIVERWMEREPLPVLHRCLQPGLLEFLDRCRAHGISLATLSD